MAIQIQPECRPGQYPRHLPLPLQALQLSLNLHPAMHRYQNHQRLLHCQQHLFLHYFLLPRYYQRNFVPAAHQCHRQPPFQQPAPQVLPLRKRLRCHRHHRTDQCRPDRPHQAPVNHQITAHHRTNCPVHPDLTRNHRLRKQNRHPEPACHHQGQRSFRDHRPVILPVRWITHHLTIHHR